jgi:hypothetical protein
VIRSLWTEAGTLATLIRMEAIYAEIKYSPKIVSLVVVVACAVSVAGHGALAMSKDTGAVTVSTCSTGIGDCAGNSRLGCSKDASDPLHGDVFSSAEHGRWRC